MVSRKSLTHFSGSFCYSPDCVKLRRPLTVKLGNIDEVNIAKLIAGHGIHILVDLNGYSMSAQPRILAMRPAPVQVNYLGYIGTMGADFIDYTIVDNFSVPPSSQPFYTEKLIHLPCYMAHDRRRAVNRETPSRTEAGPPRQLHVRTTAL